MRTNDAWRYVPREGKEPILFRDDSIVELVDSMGSDRAIREAARVSTQSAIRQGEEDDFFVGTEEEAAAHIAATEKKRYGLIRYLMKSRHGSPFEHALLKFYIATPIFVTREFQRHRIASYNEMSGRYTQMKPWFYIPNEKRNLINTGTSARPHFEPGSEEQYNLLRRRQERSYLNAWEDYEDLLFAGIGNEVARMHLPLATYTQFYVTINLRSLMNFLSLRRGDVEATFPTHPQREIEEVATKMEAIFAEKFPMVHKAFVEAGRVAP